jgi:hypothetical protein
VEWRGGAFELRVYHYSSAAECGRTYKIWGLTAYIAHQVAKIAMTDNSNNYCCCRDQLTDLNAGRRQCRVEEGPCTLSGYLFRREEGSGMGNSKPSWVRRYFVLDGKMLHQYEGERQAARKAASATKKNRVALVESNVRLIPTLSECGRHEFVVSALSGRVRWHLAAPTDEERQQWIEALS